MPDEDHIVRGVVRRGRAATERLGSELGPNDALPELTLTAEGAFLHPFAPTVEHGVTATDLQVGGEVFPLAHTLDVFLEHPGHPGPRRGRRQEHEMSVSRPPGREEPIVLVVAKAPVPGRAKTRLAAEIGAAQATALARAMLLDTLDGCRRGIPTVGVLWAGS